MAVSDNTPTLPNFKSRRRFLTMADGIAAATAAAGAVAIQAARGAPAENPELIGLGNELPAIVAEYREAHAARRAIIAEWSPQWPKAPESLTEGFSCTIERDLTGQGVQYDGKSRDIYTVNDIGWRLEEAERALRRKDIDTRTWHGKRRDGWQAELTKWQAVLADAERYEAETARIREASGFPAADKRWDEAREALAAHVAAIMAAQDTTMEGVRIKARALVAWGGVPLFWRVFTPGIDEWAPKLAAAVERHATEGAL